MVRIKKKITVNLEGDDYFVSKNQGHNLENNVLTPFLKLRGYCSFD